MLKQMLFATFVLGSLAGCAADTEEVESEATTSEVLFNQYAAPDIWADWYHYEDFGYKVKAFEGLKEDGVIDLQFIATRTQTRDRHAWVRRVAYMCGDKNDRLEVKSTAVDRELLLGRGTNYGTDMLDVARCSSGKRPRSVQATIEFY